MNLYLAFVIFIICLLTMLFALLGFIVMYVMLTDYFIADIYYELEEQ